MKKSVLFIIGIVFCLAVYFVGIHLNPIVYNPTTYVESITCTHEQYIAYTEEEKQAQIETNDFAYDGYIKIGSKTDKITYPYKMELIFRVNPDDATTKALKFELPSDSTIAVVSEYAESSCFIEFSKGGKIGLTISATDRQGGASLNILLDAYRKIL